MNTCPTCALELYEDGGKKICPGCGYVVPTLWGMEMVTVEGIPENEVYLVSAIDSIKIKNLSP